MKRNYLIAMALIVAAIGILISASKDFSSYSAFEDARKTGKLVKIVGHLAKDQEIYYNPETDANYFR